MKKLIFICLVGLFAVSCQPTEFTCDCTGTGGTGGGSVTVSGGLSLIDTNLIGHWRQTNVNSTSGDWNNGQIDLHFFENGTWHIDGTSGVFANLPYDDGSYSIHSSNCLDLGTKVLKYSINNGVLTFSPVPGQSYVWQMSPNSNANSTSFQNTLNQSYAEINNLTKQ